MRNRMSQLITEQMFEGEQHAQVDKSICCTTYEANTCDSSASFHDSGMDCVDDVADLDLLSDEDLMEGLFGRVNTEMSCNETYFPGGDHCPSEDLQFVKLRLQN